MFIFSKWNRGVRSFQKRLWKRKTILSLLPFLSLPWTFCYRGQKLSRGFVCVRATLERAWNQFLHCSQLWRFIETLQKKKKKKSYMTNVRVGWYKLLQSAEECIFFCFCCIKLKVTVKVQTVHTEDYSLGTNLQFCTFSYQLRSERKDVGRYGEKRKY